VAGTRRTGGSSDRVQSSFGSCSGVCRSWRRFVSRESVGSASRASQTASKRSTTRWRTAVTVRCRSVCPRPHPRSRRQRPGPCSVRC
jgi:hypothetical protein